MPDLQHAIPGILESWMSQETASYWQSPSSREKLSRSCLEAAKGKIKAGPLILRKSPKRTATGSSTASNISRIPIRHAGSTACYSGKIGILDEPGDCQLLAKSLFEGEIVPFLGLD